MSKPDRMSGMITFADAQEFDRKPVVPFPNENVTVRWSGSTLMGLVAEEPNELTRQLMSRMGLRERLETGRIVSLLRNQADERALYQMIPPTADHLEGWYRPFPEVSSTEVQALGLYEIMAHLGSAMLDQSEGVNDVVDVAYESAAIAQGITGAAVNTMYLHPVKPDATLFIAPVDASESNQPALLPSAHSADATQQFTAVSPKTIKFEPVQPQE